jgi:hypothetical protein
MPFDSYYLYASVDPNGSDRSPSRRGSPASRGDEHRPQEKRDCIELESFRQQFLQVGTQGVKESQKLQGLASLQMGMGECSYSFKRWDRYFLMRGVSAIVCGETSRFFELFQFRGKFSLRRVGHGAKLRDWRSRDSLHPSSVIHRPSQRDSQ